MSTHRLNKITFNRTKRLVGELILTACQTVQDYFMLRVQGMALIVHIYFHFLSSCFFISFLYTILSFQVFHTNNYVALCY